MKGKLNVAFVWHMHQPIYKDPMTEEYILPWVLFHATKDYYDMAAILEEFPEVHQTFNVVPCLIEQLNDYASGRVSDKYRSLTEKTAPALTHDERLHILRYFFQANWDTMIKPVRRYWELLLKRGSSDSLDEARSAVRYYTDQDYLDLQVLFNLVWIDPEIRRKDPFLDALYKKGCAYTEDEKKRLLDKQIDIVNKILPLYKSLMDRGIIEVSTTPYYHPIMPLLCDSYSALEAMPGATLQKERFVHPEDAVAQMKKGIKLYEETFSRPPAGIWPSEGSVSTEVLSILADEGIEWFATDEEILTNTLRRGLHRDPHGHCNDKFLYRPYRVNVNGKGISAVFRDHVISDLIGFDYVKMNPNAAADDLVGRLDRIHNDIYDPENHVVSIILDGENAWEGYSNDGRDFFVALYSRLTGHHALKCVTVGEFLSSVSHRDSLDWIYPGSWINHNFRIWIGHVEDNTAWDYIAGARAELIKKHELAEVGDVAAPVPADITEAWNVLYAAEGSDWFWWYGDDHSSMNDDIFDILFRQHIKKIYKLIGSEPPDSLDLPISSDLTGYRPPHRPTAFLTPEIDGEITSYFEWMSSGRLDRLYFGSAMHKDMAAHGLIDGIHYGFSEDALYLRFDYVNEYASYSGEWSFTVSFIYPSSVKLNVTVKGTDVNAVIYRRGIDEAGWQQIDTRVDIAAASVVEIGLPFETIGAVKGMEMHLYININGNGKGNERWPGKGYMIFDLPSEGFEEEDWIV